MMRESPRLLVSVRDPNEAEIVIDCPVDVIDIKEPRHGPLGAALPATVHAIVRLIGERRPISVAMGELVDWQAASLVGDVAGMEIDELSWRCVKYAKMGMAGCTAAAHANYDPTSTLKSQSNSPWKSPYKTPFDWRHAWQDWSNQLPTGVMPVMVAYADWRTVAAPAPSVLIDFAAANRASGLLIDTYQKSRQLFDILSGTQLASLLRRAASRGLWTAVAGSISPQTLFTAMVANPTIVAVRGAVCEGGREGKVSHRLVRELREILDRGASSPLEGCD